MFVTVTELYKITMAIGIFCSEDGVVNIVGNRRTRIRFIAYVNSKITNTAFPGEVKIVLMEGRFKLCAFGIGTDFGEVPGDSSRDRRIGIEGTDPFMKGRLREFPGIING
jgi:hypothetical protein